MIHVVFMGEVRIDASLDLWSISMRILVSLPFLIKRC